MRVNESEKVREREREKTSSTPKSSFQILLLHFPGPKRWLSSKTLYLGRRGPMFKFQHIKIIV